MSNCGSVPIPNVSLASLVSVTTEVTRSGGTHTLPCCKFLQLDVKLFFMNLIQLKSLNCCATDVAYCQAKNTPALRPVAH